MSPHEQLNYLEFPCQDLAASKAFFSAVFAWQFTDYGPDYTAFSGSGISGGLYHAALASRSENGAMLPVFYSPHIRASAERITAAGGKICRELFHFPGGCRFHFQEPSGNEFAVWSEQDS